MRKFLIFLVLAGWLFCGIPAHAADYYVATTGDNANDGLSSGTAWKTITWAVTQAASASTINVAAGTYNAAAGEVFPIRLSPNRNLLSTTTRIATIDAGSAQPITLEANSTLEGFTVKTTGASLYVVTSVGGCRVVNNLISTAYGGVNAFGTTEILTNTVTCTASAANVYLVVVRAAADGSLIQGNNIWANFTGGYGVWLDTSADNVIVDGNTIETSVY